MERSAVITQLQNNAAVFNALFTGIPVRQALWKPAPEKWCLLEILCHFYDEERLDFKARIKHILKTPGDVMPSIDPVAWVTEHKYLEQDYDAILRLFLEERDSSVNWLQSLLDPFDNNYYQHPKLGKMTPDMLLVNWLAHDHLHIRQITSVKYHYLKANTNESLDYAGNW